jgi:hypothetical protein
VNTSWVGGGPAFLRRGPQTDAVASRSAGASRRMRCRLAERLTIMGVLPGSAGLDERHGVVGARVVATGLTPAHAMPQSSASACLNRLKCKTAPLLRRGRLDLPGHPGGFIRGASLGGGGGGDPTCSSVGAGAPGDLIRGSMGAGAPGDLIRSESDLASTPDRAVHRSLSSSVAVPLRAPVSVIAVGAEG